MKWSDPFTGWRDGWIGRGHFAAWMGIFLGVGLIALILTQIPPVRDIPLSRAGVVALYVAIFLFYGLPQYNLIAKRCRDAGMRGWLSTILLVIADWIAEWLADWNYGLLIGIAMLCFIPSDKYGTRVDRGDTVDPDVFS